VAFQGFKELLKQALNVFCQIVPGFLIWDREVVGSNPLALIFHINHLRVFRDACFSSAATDAARLNVDSIVFFASSLKMSLFTTRVMGGAGGKNFARLACHTTLSYCGVAHINFPDDLQ
jgi:hypothetical protein